MRSAAPISFPSDQLLPQRDLLLDAEEIGRRLSGQLGARAPITIDDCARWRVKYRVGESLRVLYRLQAGASQYLVAARAFTGGRSSAAYRRAAAVAVPCEPLRATLHDADLDAVFWTFPNDRKIANLPLLRNVGGALAHVCTPAWTGSRLVAYAPEKSATAQCLSTHGEVLAYAKLYAGDEGAHVAQLYAALSRNIQPDDLNLRIPRVLAYSAEHRMLLLEPVEGQRIADLEGPALAAGMERLGAALATLHNLPSPAVPGFTRLDPDRLHGAAALVGWSRPDVATLAEQLAGELAARYEPSPERPVCLHGDLHPKNGILSDGRVTLIDLDQAAVGPAAADLGSLLAGLCYCCRIGLISNITERRLGAAFLAGYASIRPLPHPAALRWSTAAALLAERALRAVNRVRPEGVSHLDGLLADAWELLRIEDTRRTL